MAQLLREAAEEIVRRAQRPGSDPFEGLIGTIAEAPADLAENHDHYLYGAMRLLHLPTTRAGEQNHQLCGLPHDTASSFS